jgi:hypothetical protein
MSLKYKEVKSFIPLTEAQIQAEYKKGYELVSHAAVGLTGEIQYLFVYRGGVGANKSVFGQS